MWHVYAKTESGFHKHFGEGKSILPHQLVIHNDFMERGYIPCPGQKFPYQHGFSVEYTIRCILPCYNLPVHQPRTFQRPWLFACILTDFIISVWPRKDHNNCRQWFRLTISIRKLFRPSFFLYLSKWTPRTIIRILPKKCCCHNLAYWQKISKKLYLRTPKANMKLLNRSSE